MASFKIKSDYQPMGDQPAAIEALTKNLEQDIKEQVLLGVTGSGKTFTMANVIQNTQKPTLVLSHNKTLAAQLYNEFKNFFPDNAMTIFLVPVLFIRGEPFIKNYETGVFLVLLINSLLTAIGGITLNYALRHVSPTLASQVNQLKIIFTLIIGFVFFDELPTLLGVLGGCLVIAAIYFIGMREKRIKAGEATASS